MFSRKPTLVDESALIIALEIIRTNPLYHSAEELRRNTSGGARSMASAAEGSAEYSAVLLLISTWETIALLISGVKKKDKIFEVTPICHMHRELKEAIEHLRGSIPDFGANFTKLNTEYEAWLRKQKKDARYVTAACNGMHARFG